MGIEDTGNDHPVRTDSGNPLIMPARVLPSDGWPPHSTPRHILGTHEFAEQIDRGSLVNPVGMPLGPSEHH